MLSSLELHIINYLNWTDNTLTQFLDIFRYRGELMHVSLKFGKMYHLDNPN